jgi:UDP-N-acetylmuramate: L-alanyl-gamma-D-glutamyl-meso-diaminopimelate ligase
MRLHFIAIGGSAMHNLAIALHLKGDQVSGSDDEIFDPAKSRLLKYGLLPDSIGWNPERIDSSLDAVILGMHARIDNPELLKAKSLGLKIYSYPEYLYEQSENKLRIVVGGSHGKTTITSMIIHVLQEVGLECDYMVGAQLKGFEVMVKLTQTAKIMVIEGDEYLTSPIDRRPKFHLYKPNIGIISGIAWDHVNVFPTFDNYVEQFEIFASSIPENGKYIYCSDDQVLTEMSSKITQTEKVPYTFHPYSIKNGVTYLVTPFGDISLQVFGKHNLANINAAKHACLSVGVTEKQFYQAISSFKGASSRLELLESNAYCSVYKDFAHSPSKLKATIEAVKEQFDDRLIVACMELHTFSSLSEQFLKEYYGCMDKADMAIVFFNPEAIVHKKLPPISSKMVFDAFGRSDLEVLDNREKLESKLLNIKEKEAVFIMMSSGNFNGIDLQAFSKKLVLLRN